VSDIAAGMSTKKAATKWSVPQPTLTDMKRDIGLYRLDSR